MGGVFGVILNNLLNVVNGVNGVVVVFSVEICELIDEKLSELSKLIVGVIVLEIEKLGFVVKIVCVLIGILYSFYV